MFKFFKRNAAYICTGIFSAASLTMGIFYISNNGHLTNRNDPYPIASDVILLLFFMGFSGVIGCCIGAPIQNSEISLELDRLKRIRRFNQEVIDAPIEANEDHLAPVHLDDLKRTYQGVNIGIW